MNNYLSLTKEQQQKVLQAAENKGSSSNSVLFYFKIYLVFNL